jgi:hypothetical protein
LKVRKSAFFPLAKYEKFPRMFTLRGTRELNKGKRARCRTHQPALMTIPPAVICYRFSDEEAVSMNVNAADDAKDAVRKATKTP